MKGEMQCKLPTSWSGAWMLWKIAACMRPFRAKMGAFALLSESLSSEKRLLFVGMTDHLKKGSKNEEGPTLGKNKKGGGARRDSFA